MLIAGCFVLTAVANFGIAGPSVSGGVPPAPMITTMSIETPVAGVDYPTETNTSMTAVLALYEARIPIFDVVPTLVPARAGRDFPTDSTPPFWTRFQRVLRFSSHERAPVRLSVSGGALNWSLPNGDVVVVSEITEIRRSEAGVDYPTDAPSREFYLLVMKDGSRIPL